MTAEQIQVFLIFGADLAAAMDIVSLWYFPMLRERSAHEWSFAMGTRSEPCRSTRYTAGKHESTHARHRERIVARAPNCRLVHSWPEARSNTRKNIINERGDASRRPRSRISSASHPAESRCPRSHTFRLLAAPFFSISGDVASRARGGGAFARAALGRNPLIEKHVSREKKKKSQRVDI